MAWRAPRWRERTTGCLAWFLTLQEPPGASLARRGSNKLVVAAEHNIGAPGCLLATGDNEGRPKGAADPKHARGLS